MSLILSEKSKGQSDNSRSVASTFDARGNG